ncbi:hypothetical protein EZS27_024644 [termite gut metagenome]|uniref:Uncharacterized protein n=1 Tax=termite gut metagenome TaxID=433724 RepID=A0A5J4QYP2_9ZZZZ
MNSLGTLFAVDNENNVALTHSEVEGYSSLFSTLDEISGIKQLGSLWPDSKELNFWFSNRENYEVKPFSSFLADSKGTNFWFSNLYSIINNNETKQYSQTFTGTKDKLQELDNQQKNNDTLIFQINLNANDINNQERVSFLDTEITPLLVSLIKNEDFEFGYNSESIRLVLKEISENELAAKEWFNRLFNRYYGSEMGTTILIGLLHIIEFLHDSLNSIAQTIALASLSHKNNEVKELGVRILEASCTIENLNILKNIKTDTQWLQDYINQVIADFEQVLCQS